jgi:N-acetylglucosaminyldiphosphoundecaprenol N-acetyl-beta-D-mannosaminyltransferase
MAEIAGFDRVNILGVGVSAINMVLAREAILEAVRQRAKGYICVTGVHGVIESQSDPQLRAIHNRAYLCTPDGMPMSWIGRLRGFAQMDRVYGPDLMLEICGISAEQGIKHFLYGGANGVAELLKQRLVERFPGLQVVGTFEPPFRPLNATESRELQAKVTAVKPDIFWVGLSTPKQERFMAEYLPKLPVILMVGVGAAFDIHCGQLRQAPRWMQRHGLEWLFRLGCEPRRLWRRYFRNNPLFVLLLCCQTLGLKKYRLE